MRRFFEIAVPPAMLRFDVARVLVLAGLLAAMSVAVPVRSLAASFTVLQGYDLFSTVTGPDPINAGISELLGVPLEGVGLGTFDFGGTVGVQGVGDADTIVLRLEDAVVAGAGQTDTIAIELVALQLVTVVPVDLGLGLDFYFVTLSAMLSTGTMDVTFMDVAGGTANSILNVNFDLRKGSLTGPIVPGLPPILPLVNDNDREWGRTPPPDARKIADANFELNGIDTMEDFWLGVSKTGVLGGCVIHGGELVDTSHCITAAVPEPGTGLLLMTGVLGLAWRVRKRLG